MDECRKKPGWLFLIPWGLESVGGVNTVVKSLISEINQEGKYTPIVLISDWSCKSPKISVLENYTEIRWRLYSLSFSSVKSFLGAASNFIRIKNTFRDLCKSFNVQVFNPHYPNSSSFLFLFLRKDFDFRIIFSFHGLDVTNLKKESLLNLWIWRCVLEKSSAIVFCSNGLRKRFLEIFPGFIDKSRAIHNGVSENFFREKDSSTCDSIKFPSKVILSVGTFEEKKGQDVLIKAFSEMVRDFPVWNLVMVGRKTPYLEYYQNLVESLNLQKSVHFYCNISPSSMPDIYSQADVFVLPSNVEPFGLVLLEAAIFDLPVIATRTDGALEIIEDKKDGILVNIGSVDELRESLVEIIQVKEKANKLSSSLKFKATSQFTWSKCYRSYVELIESS